MEINWNYRYDVVVVGSGAAGFTAALTAKLKGLSVLLVEKNSTFGGSTARSGGAIWIPNNTYLHEAGLDESFEKGQRYLAATVGDRTPQALQDAYLIRGGEMVEYLREKSHVKWDYVKGYSDYYPDRDGGEPRGRTIESTLFDLSLLGDDLEQMGRSVMPTQGMVLTAAEFHDVNMIRRTWAGKKAAVKVGLRLIRSRLTSYKPASLGEALIGRLALSYKENSGELWLNAPFKKLHLNNDGDVIGITIDREGKEVNIRAHRGVILTSGGFSHNQAMREKYLPKPTNHEWSMAAEGQTGDIFDEAIRAGGELDLMNKVWGTPTTPLPNTGTYMPVAERAIPGAIVVDKHGKRYLNEALPYHEFLDRMYTHNAVLGEDDASVPSWFIFDQRVKRRYLVFGILPGMAPPKEWISSGFLKKSQSIEGLAKEIGIDADTFGATVRRFNGFAKEGVDEDFQKGGNAYDHFYGDPTLDNPNLAPINEAPFYALPLFPGDIGTKGGVKMDEHARAIHADGTPIRGLYVAGNCSASVMGETYPGAGATLGPAMTFGYIAATHLVDMEETFDDSDD